MNPITYTIEGLNMFSPSAGEAPAALRSFASPHAHSRAHNRAQSGIGIFYKHLIYN